MGQASQWVGTLLTDTFSWPRVRRVSCSIVDQGLSVGGMFLANIALARTQSKEEYGIFALTYSVYTFLAGLHNAAILEAYTIYGSGRYHEKFLSYSRLIWRSHLRLVIGLAVTLMLSWRVLSWTSPALASPTILGMAMACAILLTASFLRRTFYIRRRPELAARFSLVFFTVCAALLWLSVHAGFLNGFCAFAIAAGSWSVAAISVARELPGRAGVLQPNFLKLEPGYWSEHWKYARWVLVTALVFQLTTQAYYWLAAGYLSVRDVADLRAMYNVVTPVEQLFSAVTLLILPMLSFRYATRRMAGVLSLWKGYCLGWLVVTGVFAVIVNVFARPLMHVLYAGRFDDIASLVGTLALVPVVMGVGNTMNAALKSIEKPQLVFYAYVASGAATFLIGIPLIVHFGLRGAVYGLLSSAGVYTSALGVAFTWSAHVQAYMSPLPAAAKEGPLP